MIIMNSEGSMKIFFEFGKSIRGTGSWMLWGMVICPIITFISFFIWPFFQIRALIHLCFICGFLSLGASLVFLILLGTYTIKMIVRGFRTATVLKIDKYRVFSRLKLISLITSSLMYIYYAAFILTKITTDFIGIFNDPYGYIGNVYLEISNTILVLSFILVMYLGLVTGSILRIISWPKFRTALIYTSNDSKIQKAANRAQLIFIALIIIEISGLIISVSFLSSWDVVMLIAFFPYLIFYVVEAIAYRSLGKNIKEYYNSAFEPEKSIITKKPRKHGQIISTNSQNVDIYCPECGSSNPKINKFCLVCGNDLK